MVVANLLEELIPVTETGHAAANGHERYDIVVPSNIANAYRGGVSESEAMGALGSEAYIGSVPEARSVNKSYRHAPTGGPAYERGHDIF